MRFGVDAHAIGRQQTGNEVYIRNLLREFSRLDVDSEFVAYVSEPEASGEIPTAIATSRVSSNPYRRLGFDLPARLRQHCPDLLHVQYTAPVGARVPIVTSVHDVSFLECPQFFTRYRAAQLRLTVKRTVEAAAKVITVSEFSRRAILKHYRVDPAKVVMIPNAAAAAFHPVHRETAARRVAEKYGIRAPFVLTVGDLQPRKNHRGLLEAFESLLRAHPELPHHLVMVGKETWHSPEIHRAVERSGMRDRVHFTGFVDDVDLVDFYGACGLFVFPSFYEGFGLPILEAMACGRAVACSDTTAMPEVADHAGILFDPHSTPKMARAMAQVLLDSELRVSLERRGLQRAKLFSWERSARLTLDAYYEVAGAERRLEDAHRVLLPTAAG